LLLDIQDAFSQNSGLISNFTVGAKEFRDCFSGTSFMRWLRDDGGRHLSEHAVDFSHEGERKRRVQQRVAHAPVTMVAGVLCQLAQEMLDEHIMRSLSDNPQFYVPHVRLSVVRSRPAAAAAPPPHFGRDCSVFPLTFCRSASDKPDASGLSLYRFAKHETEEYIEKNASVRDSLAKQLLHNSKGSGSMHRSNSAREESDMPDVSSIGEIDFRGVIMLRLISCKDLPKGGSYVRFTLGKQSLKSKSVSSSSNPVFNEVLMLSWDGRARLRGVVYATSLFGKDEEIGNVDVNLAERSSFENLPLQPSITACFSRSAPPRCNVNLFLAAL
jgi:hypothetical protein